MLTNNTKNAIANEVKGDTMNAINYITKNIKSFMPDEYADLTIRMDEVMKEGGRLLHGISFVPESGDGVAPLVYIDSAVKALESGEYADDVLEKLANIYLEAAAGVPNVLGSIKEPSVEALREGLRVKMVNQKYNEEVLKDRITLPTGRAGLVLTAYSDIGGGVVNLTKKNAEHLGMTEQEIIMEAISNSMKLDPPVLTPLHAAAFGERPNIFAGEAESDGLPMVLTNTSGYFGAWVLFSEGMRAKLEEIVGGSYFVIPSSVHELLIMPDDGTRDADELNSMVQFVNEMEVAPEERLGDHVYYHNAEDGTFKEM